MNVLKDEGYERVARWLDGDGLALTAEERAVAEELRRDESAVGSLLDTPPPGRALDRARRRANVALKGRVPRWRVGLLGGAAAAAAAALVAIVLFPAPEPPPTRIAANPAPRTTGTAFLAALNALATEDEIDTLAGDLDEIAADIVLTARPELHDPVMDVRIDMLEREIDEVYDALAWPSEG